MGSVLTEPAKAGSGMIRWAETGSSSVGLPAPGPPMTGVLPTTVTGVLPTVAVPELPEVGPTAGAEPAIGGRAVLMNLAPPETGTDAQPAAGRGAGRSAPDSNLFIPSSPDTRSPNARSR